MSWPKNQPSFFPVIKKRIIKNMEICVNACLKKIIIYASTWLGNIFWKLTRKCITDFYVRKKQRKVNIFTFSWFFALWVVHACNLSCNVPTTAFPLHQMLLLRPYQQFLYRHLHNCWHGNTPTTKMTKTTWEHKILFSSPQKSIIICRGTLYT